MTNSVTWAALAVAAVLLSGCGQLTVMSDGRLMAAWDTQQGASDILGSVSLVDAPPAPVLQAFDAAEGAAAGSADPNSRAGANCSGGVCAIF
jgi:hypothetical protein